mmetsp:Transcript_26019/g.56750  ORF Transcript_26019/g.56750 Transcript_26019/m.56750 type:complete len:260 (-) Transcript_26019:492-1271(-)
MLGPRLIRLRRSNCPSAARQTRQWRTIAPQLKPSQLVLPLWQHLQPRQWLPRHHQHLLPPPRSVPRDQLSQRLPHLLRLVMRRTLHPPLQQWRQHLRHPPLLLQPPPLLLHLAWLAQLPPVQRPTRRGSARGAAATTPSTVKPRGLALKPRLTALSARQTGVWSSHQTRRRPWRRWRVMRRAARLQQAMLVVSLQQPLHLVKHLLLRMGLKRRARRVRRQGPPVLQVPAVQRGRQVLVGRMRRTWTGATGTKLRAGRTH